jgi:hypothetical protein
MAPLLPNADGVARLLASSMAGTALDPSKRMTQSIVAEMSAPSPVAVGGIGGSGTRLIAEILRRLDYYMGEDLNRAGDNLWFTLLFKRTELLTAGSRQDDFEQAVCIFRAVMSGGAALTPDQEAFVRSLAIMDRPQHTAAWLRRRVESLLDAAQGPARHPWGWKAPNTHILLDRFYPALPHMRYIHVMRNGLDMAFSKNQNQLKLWGRYFFGEADYEVSPRWSLKYWCLVHRRITRLGEQLMPGRYMLLNYDAFCAVPQAGLRALLRFLGLTVGPSTEASLVALVRQPDSIGRFKQHNLQLFDPEDLECVKAFGFDTTEIQQ